MRLRNILRFWLDFEYRVTRRAYLASAAVLAPLKYAGDALLVWGTTGKWWAPWDYLTGSGQSLLGRMASAPSWAVVAMVAWTVPFLWIGLTLTVRRALDAGRSPWWATLFFVPGANWLTGALLAALPSRPPAPAAARDPRSYDAELPRALRSVLAGATLMLGMVALCVYALGGYGLALFFGTPFMGGWLTAWLFNRRYPATARETREVVLLTFVLTAGALVATAAEGLVCLVMAMPIALLLGVMGATLGRDVALRGASRQVREYVRGVALLPLAALVEAGIGHDPAPLREVRSSVEVDAPPAVVWRHVVAFPPLDAPTEWVFRAGIAYPVEARIDGAGVGAVRRCVFSTGAFVEPITAWEPGRRLAFDVVDQPRPLTEWSPWSDVTPPHLDGWFASRRGEFRLVALPGGRTRLEGSTWYELRLQPAAYWVIPADWLVHAIHGRVLRHVKRVAEAGA